MNSEQLVPDEKFRLKELSHYGVVLDEKEEAFCDIAKIAMLFTGNAFRRCQSGR